MLIEENKFVFGKYLEQYGIYDENLLEYVGFRDDAPDEAKKSWEEYQKFRAEMHSQGINA